MLGAAHACANPLTAHYGTEHGVAVALLLPTIVRWNSCVAGDRYKELLYFSGSRPASDDSGKSLAARLEQLIEAAELPGRLSSIGVPRDDLPMLAEESACQWTGRFNPRQLDVTGALEVYECAY